MLMDGRVEKRAIVGKLVYSLKDVGGPAPSEAKNDDWTC
jgi:hypothetical protein